MAYDEALAARVRSALDGVPGPVREVKMFGGLSFMVNETLVVSVGGNGDLLVRADPSQAAQLLEIDGAEPAEMGEGRAMGGGWITVLADAIVTDENVNYWVGVALEYNAKRSK